MGMIMKLYSTIKDIIVSSEATFGSEDAIRYKVGKDQIEAKSYTDLKKDSESFSRVLESFGIIGQHIALSGMTSYTWLVTYFGIVNSGSVAVPLDVSLPAEDFCELVDRSDAVALVLDDLRADVAAIVKERCPKVKYLISMQKEVSDENSLSFAQLLKENVGSFDKEIDPEALCTIMFTSGTTGKSKGVMLTQRNLAENATTLDMKIPPRNVLLSVLPIHHAYCLSMDILQVIPKIKMAILMVQENI